MSVSREARDWRGEGEGEDGGLEKQPICLGDDSPMPGIYSIRVERGGVEGLVGAVWVEE